MTGTVSGESSLRTLVTLTERKALPVPLTRPKNTWTTLRRVRSSRRHTFERRNLSTRFTLGGTRSECGAGAPLSGPVVIGLCAGTAETAQTDVAGTTGGSES